MCMQNAQEWKRGEKKPTQGWKVFKKTEDKEVLESRFGTARYKKGRWYSAKCDSENKSTILYPPGFHTFFSRNDARRYCRAGNSGEPSLIYIVRRVAVRTPQHKGGTSLGLFPLPTFTCDAIKIL